jgi:type I restriction enzyme, S subunit
VSSPDCVQPPLRYSDGVPLGWDSRRLKFSVKLRNEKVDAECIGSAYIGLENIESWTGRLIEAEVASGEGVATKFNKDDVLFGKLRPYLAKVYLASEPGISSTETLVLTAENILTPSFLKFVLLSSKFIGSVSGSAYGAKMPRANWDFIGGYSVLIPPLKKQQQIADFLDFKAAKIDALIAKKQALIERLKEKRLAVITQAVTKGLNPDVPLRDSGIPWLGGLPAHWEVKRLRFACARIEQGWSPQCESQVADEDSWGVMKVGCVNGDTFDASENKALPLDLEPVIEYRLFPNDILISRANTKELLGSAALVPADVPPKLLLCDKLFRLRPSTGVDEKFLTYYLRTPSARFQYEREATGASGSMQNIGQGTIKDLVVCLPPIHEQKRIVEYVCANSAKLDTHAQILQAAILRLTEYRAVLITEAITGELDMNSIEIPS